MRIAVIGGGVFGSVIALKLAESGFEVTIFERKEAILLGSTPKSVMRLHLGLHYPRDLQTAIQSRLGYSQFLAEFRESVDLGFENFYGIANLNSKVSTKDFLKFLEAAGIEFAPRLISDLRSYGFASEKIESLFSCAEGVIDINRLRTDLEQRLSATNVNVCLGTEVTSSGYLGERWYLTSSLEVQEGPYDFVIKATYGGDQMGMIGVKGASKKFEFQETLVLRTQLGLTPFGMTVIDGDFLTVLPEAFSDNHLLYGPSVSILRRTSGEVAPKEYLANPTTNVAEPAEAILSRYREWFPDAPEPSLINSMVTLRTIEQGVQSSDRRVTEIHHIAPAMYSVISGKIDHCLFAAEKCLALVLQESKKHSGARTRPLPS
jgi:hypothetical protein